MLKYISIYIIYFFLLPKALSLSLQRKLSNLNHNNEIFLRVKGEFDIKMLKNNFKKIPIQILLNGVLIEDNSPPQIDVEKSNLKDIYQITNTNINSFEETEIYSNSDRIEDINLFSEKDGHSHTNDLSDIEDIDRPINIRHLSDADKTSNIDPILDTEKLFLDPNEISESENPSDIFNPFSEDYSLFSDNLQKKESLIHQKDMSDISSSSIMNPLFVIDSKNSYDSNIEEINSQSDINNLPDSNKFGPDISDNSEEINISDKNNIINITLIWDNPLIDCSYLFYNLSSIIFADL